MVLTNTTFLGCGFKSLGFLVLSPMGAAGTKQKWFLQRLNMMYMSTIRTRPLQHYHKRNRHPSSHGIYTESCECSETFFEALAVSNIPISEGRDLINPHS